MNVGVRRRLVRTVVTLAIALVSTALAVLATVAPGLGGLIVDGNEVPYDTLYKFRTPQSRPDAAIVLVEIDDASLLEAANLHGGGMAQQWPWPRGLWGAYVDYFQRQGARCVVFDLHFTEPAVRGGDDDQDFAHALDAASIPVIFAGVGPDHRFAPPVRKPPVLADADISGVQGYTTYSPITDRGPSLALTAVRAAGLLPALPIDRPIRLLYHGPHTWGDQQTVFPAFRASKVYAAIFNPADALPEDTFKGKIVLVGATAAGLGDIKVAPVDTRYPGVEVHATAIDNLISGQTVRVAMLWLPPVVAVLLSLAAASGVIFVRPVIGKAITLAVCASGLAFLIVVPMLAPVPFWLPPMVPLIALVLSVVIALIFTFRIEDARARLLLRALGQCVSPYIAAELAEDPQRLKVGSATREMTILFSDIAGFTSLTETLRERIEPVLNYYLGEMSRQAFAANGTIDKYIGDAMMVFWNAPVNQADHAALACRAALAIAAHERAIGGRLAELGAANLRTRIGINSGPVVVGFFGSAQRLSYTAIGDAVNLAARLEPGNKNYGTQILVSETTRALAGDGFVFRRLDRLRVYGRHEPAEVYELMADRAAADAETLWVATQFDVAVGQYFAQDWCGAEATLAGVLARRPEDGPSLVLRKRIAEFRANSPGAHWDGVYTATGK